jgi:hypothetical protein
MKSKSLLCLFFLQIISNVISKNNNDISSDLSMDWFEKDKILSCVEIITRKIKKDKVDFLFKIISHQLEF